MTFMQNKYTNWYYQIIDKAKREKRIKSKNVYYESHHVIPKCKPFGGTNEKENLVLLLPREHFICHWLLTKMCEGEYKWKMQYAINKMLQNEKNAKINKHIFSKVYFEIARKQILEAAFSRAKSNGWPMEGKTHTEEAKIKMRNAKLGKSRNDLTVEVRGHRNHSQETKNKIGESLKGRPVSNITKEKLSLALQGKKQNKTIIECDYCGVKNYATQIKRYHNVNCKHKIIG
jgi:hypothetical protein